MLPHGTGPWVVLLPHASVRFTSHALDTAFAAVPTPRTGARALYVPNLHSAEHRTALGGRFFATFADFAATGAHEHSVDIYAAELPRRLPGVEWSVATVHPATGEIGAAPAPLRAFALVVVSADLTHGLAPHEAWALDSEFLSNATAAGGRPHGAPDHWPWSTAERARAGTCSLPGVRWLTRSLLPAVGTAPDGGRVLDHYTSASLDEHGADERFLPAAAPGVSYAACVWPPAGAELSDAAALEAAADLCAERAVLAVAWVAFARRLGRDAFEVPRWAELQLARSGYGDGLGAYVTVRDGAHGRVRCCLGHHQQARVRLSDVLGHVLDKCAAQVPRESPSAAEPLENLTVTLLRPVASGRVVPAGAGPGHGNPDPHRWYAELGSPSVGLGVLDATPGTETFGGVLFLPSVWPEHAEWSWDDLLRQLRLKAETLRGKRFAAVEAGVQPYLIPSRVITAETAAVGSGPPPPRRHVAASGGTPLADLWQ